MFESGVKTIFSSFDLLADVALKLSDVVDASWIYYEKNSDWPSYPEDIKSINLKDGKCVDLSIYDYLQFDNNSENALLVNFSLKPYEFYCEKGESFFYTSKIIGVLRFQPSLEQKESDAWIRFIQFEAKGKKTGLLKSDLKLISKTKGEFLCREFISRWNRIKQKEASGTHHPVSQQLP